MIDFFSFFIFHRLERNDQVAWNSFLHLTGAISLIVSCGIEYHHSGRLQSIKFLVSNMPFFHIVFKTCHSVKMENLRRRSTDATRNWMIGWRKGWMLKVYGALERFWIRSVKVSWHHPVKSWEFSPRWVFFKWPPCGLISWTKSDGAVTTATTRTLDDQRASLHRSPRSSTIRSMKTWHHEARQWHPLELPRHPKSPAPSHVESVLQRLPWTLVNGGWRWLMAKPQLPWPKVVHLIPKGFFSKKVCCISVAFQLGIQWFFAFQSFFPIDFQRPRKKPAVFAPEV